MYKHCGSELALVFLFHVVFNGLKLNLKFTLRLRVHQMVTLFTTINIENPSENNALSQNSAEVCSTETNWASRGCVSLSYLRTSLTTECLYKNRSIDLTSFSFISAIRFVQRDKQTPEDLSLCCCSCYLPHPAYHVMIVLSSCLPIHLSSDHPSINPTIQSLSLRQNWLVSHKLLIQISAPCKWLLFWDQQHTAVRADTMNTLQ